MKVYLPSWNGDMRLVDDPDAGGARLTLVDPTPQELVVAGAFLRQAAAKGWWKGDAPKKGEPYRGKPKDLPVLAPIDKASRLLISVSRPKDRTLTAVKLAGGKIETVEGASSRSLEAAEKAIARAKASEKPGRDAAAASVKRPTPSCPDCRPGAIGPATEALLSFLSPSQHEQWARERAILVEGHLSGHRYVVAHRNSGLAVRMGRMCYDVDDGLVVHFHDWSVPPEEEVLAAKLVLEHAEPWLRNEATMLGAGAREVYKNPFGNYRDGTESAKLAHAFGSGLMEGLKVAAGR